MRREWPRLRTWREDADGNFGDFLELGQAGFNVLGLTFMAFHSGIMLGDAARERLKRIDALHGRIDDLVVPST